MYSRVIFVIKIDFFALNDCLCVIIIKNDGVQFLAHLSRRLTR